MKNNKLNTMIPLLGFMLFFIQGDSYATSPLLIAIAEDFNISISQAGLTVVSYMIPFGLFTLLFGPLGDKIGKLKLISIAAFGTTIFSALGGIAPNFLTLCILRAFNGAFAAAIMPVSIALIGEVSGNNPKQLHISLSRTMALMFFGGAVAPLIGGTLSHFGSWRFVYIFYGALELILSVLIITLIRFESVKTEDLSIARAYKEALSNKRLIKTISVMCLLGITVLGGYTYMGKYIQQSTGISVFHVGIILSFYGFGTLIGGRVAPKLKEILKDRYFITASAIGSVSLLLLAFIPNIYVLPVSLLGLGFTFTLIQPMLIAQAQGAFPQKRGTVMSLASFNMSIGAGIGTLLYGFILKQYDFILIYLSSAVLFLFIAVLTTRVSKKKQIPV